MPKQDFKIKKSQRKSSDVAKCLMAIFILNTVLCHGILRKKINWKRESHKNSLNFFFCK
jgi:hypothetical protein